MSNPLGNPKDLKEAFEHAKQLNDYRAIKDYLAGKFIILGEDTRIDDGFFNRAWRLIIDGIDLENPIGKAGENHGSDS